MKGWRWHYLALWFPAIFSPKPFPSSPFHILEIGLVTLSIAGCLYIYLRCFLFCSMSQWCIRKSGLKSPRGSHIHVSILTGFLIWSQGPDRCSLNLVPLGLLFLGITTWMWNVTHTLKGVSTCSPATHTLKRCEHLFPSWGLTLSGIYLEEEGHWLGSGGVEYREVSLPGHICCPFSTSLLWIQGKQVLHVHGPTALQAWRAVVSPTVSQRKPSA